MSDKEDVVLNDADELREAARAAFEAVEAKEPTTEVVEKPELEVTEQAETPEAEEPEGEGDAEPEAKADEPAKEAPKPKSPKAPQDWDAPARELFDKLPDDVKAAVHRREAKINDVLKNTKADRDLASVIKQISAPYERDLAEANTNAVAVYDEFLKASKTLRHGTAKEKSNLIALIIKQHKVDLESLQDELIAVMGNQPAATTQHAVPQELTAKIAQLEQAEMQRRNAAIADAYKKSGVEEKEFFNDVRDEMAFLLESGKAKDFTDAYNKAIWLNEGTREVMTKRQTAFTNAGASTSQKLAAASSVKSTAASGTTATKRAPKQYDDVHDAARAAILKFMGPNS